MLDGMRTFPRERDWVRRPEGEAEGAKRSEHIPPSRPSCAKASDGKSSTWPTKLGKERSRPPKLRRAVASGEICENP